MLQEREIDDVPDQEKARDMLEELCHKGFDGPHMAAVALGRDESLIDAILEGREEVDADLAMKIQGIASERHVPVDDPG